MARSTRGKRRRGGRKGAPGPATRVRDTITGRFLKRGSEKKRPQTTIVERIRGRGGRRGKR